MANTQVTTRDTQLEDQRRGLLRLTLTNFQTLNEPAIEAGSVVEIAGSLFVVTADEAISGWSSVPNETEAYIKLSASGGSFSASFTTTPPSWDSEKQGWYDGNERYIGGVRRESSSVYLSKWIYQRSQDNNDNHRFWGDGRIWYTGIGSIEGSSISENLIFDTLDRLIPNNGDEMLITGSLKGSSTPDGVGMYVFSKAERTSTTTIELYGIRHTETQVTRDSITMTNGGGTSFDEVSIAFM